MGFVLHIAFFSFFTAFFAKKKFFDGSRGIRTMGSENSVFNFLIF
jgi:hypothetical protein